MSDTDSELDGLRREIDAVDRQLLELLASRAALAERIGAAKAGTGGPTWRPAREALVLRRLLSTDTGRFPRLALIRIWRELFGAALSLQGRFIVSVPAVDGDRTYATLARNHFGVAAETDEQASARGVLRALGDGTANVGLLPLPEDGESEPWWPSLIGQLDQPLRIVARLPVGMAVDDRNGTGALAVAGADPEPTGADHAYFVLWTKDGLSRTGLNALLVDHGLDPRFIAAAPGDGDGMVMFLVEVGDFLAPDDDRLATLTGAENSRVLDVRVLGCYPRPLTQDDLSAAPAEETTS